MVIILNIATRARTDFIDITQKVNEAVKDSKMTEGVCYVFIPHTTASITINENADPDVFFDIKKELEKIIPFDDKYQHTEGNSAAHIKASIIGSSESVLVENGRLLLGTWQGIFLCEFDGPRQRKVFVKII